MNEYTLFGKQISFTQAETAFCAAMCKIDYECTNAIWKFKNWYDNCGNISKVLNDYPNYAYNILNSLAIDELYHVFLDNGIYDMSESVYLKSVVDDSFFENYSEVLEVYEKIEDDLATEKEFRAVRKAGRVEIARTFNDDYIGTQIGESIKNGFGNMMSTLGANIEKNDLYSKSFEPLCSGLLESIRLTILRHIEFANNKIGNVYSYDAFDIKKSQAFLENAIKLPEKRNDLLFDALKNAVWNMDVVSYILLNCPDEIETVCAMSKEMGFTYKIKELIEKIFNSMYVGEATENNDAANALRDKILSMMSEYGVSSSSTLKQLEDDCLARVTEGYEEASEAECEQYKERVKNTPYNDELKEEYIDLLQERMLELANNCLSGIIKGYEKADEATCNRMKEEIKNTTYSSELKMDYLMRVQKRIEEIWSAQDGEIFDNIFFHTNIFDPKSVNAATEYIKSKGRTESAEKYLKALGRCNANDIKKAKMHKFGNVLSILAIVFFIVMLFLPKPIFILRLIIGLVGGIALLAWGGTYIVAWDDLTLNGKFIHPMLEQKNKK